MTKLLLILILPLVLLGAGCTTAGPNDYDQYGCRIDSFGQEDCQLKARCLEQGGLPGSNNTGHFSSCSFPPQDL